MKKLKNYTLIALVLLAIVIALQNTEAVDTKLLFVTVTMPRALLLLVASLIGFAAGVLTGGSVAPKRDDN